MGPIECHCCERDLLNGDIKTSRLHPMCCLDCERAYPNFIRMEERLSTEERKTDAMQSSILTLLHRYPSECKNKKSTVDSELFEKLWKAADLRYHDSQTLTDFLGESL